MKIARVATLVLACFATSALAADQDRQPIRDQQPIVLAQEFLLPPPGPAPATCNSIVTAGGDIGETHPIDVSGTTGTIRFQFDTAAQPDRMVVFLDRNLAYDSGCVGTNGWRSRNIPLPPGTMKLIVRIEPNCTGGSGTFWTFKLECPTD